MVDIKATRRAKATANFFKKAVEVHADKYDYSKVNYVDTVTKVRIICPIHGEFLQQPGKHINSANGCTQCVYDSLRTGNDEYVDTLKKVTDGELQSLEPYINKHTKILHQHSCGYTWKVSPHSILKNKGCPTCAEYGFNPLKPAILYYLKVVNHGVTAYKIGITNTTLERRFSGDMKYITVLKTWEYSVGADALQAEQTILKLNKDYSYTGIPLLSSGNTELFYKDVGGYDE